jgi:aspartokinase-like uncharacterized kinase
VVKLGGSLLDVDDLPDRLLAALSDVDHPIVVVGGGSAADLVRQWNSQGLVNDSEAHRLAIAAMSFNALQLAASDRRLVLVKSRDAALEASLDGWLPLLDATSTLLEALAVPSQWPSLPESWEVTSDSIAAWLACAWNGDLRLLKSVPSGAAPLDHVDAWFEHASRGLEKLTWINLRALPLEVTSLPLPISHRRDRHVPVQRCD